MQSSKEQQGEIRKPSIKINKFKLKKKKQDTKSIKKRKRKPSSVINAKKQRKTIEWERLEIFSRKLEMPRELSCKDVRNKGHKVYGPNRCRRY